MAFVSTPLLFNASHAAVVTVDFSGTVVQVTGKLSSSQFGTTFAGSFSYDNAAPATYQGLNYYGGTTAIYAPSGFALNFSGGYSFPELSDRTLELETSTISQVSSGWFFNANSLAGQPAQASFSFEGPAGYVSTASLAVPLPFFNGLSSQTRPISVEFFDANLRAIGGVVGKIASINYVSTAPDAGGPVLTPEPVSIVLLGVGLAGTAAARRRIRLK